MGINKEHFQGVPGRGPCRSIPTVAFGLFWHARERYHCGWIIQPLFSFHWVLREIGTNYRFRLFSGACSVSIWRKINGNYLISSDDYIRQKD